MNTPKHNAAPKPGHRRFQYSLAGLLGFTTIVSIGLSILKSLQVALGTYTLAFLMLFAIGGSILIVACFASVAANAQKGVRRTPFGYASPEDALADAFQLEMDGDWDAAVLLYAQIAGRWPEHKQECRERVLRVEEERLRVKQP